MTADPVSPVAASPVAAMSTGDPTSSVAVLVGREPAHRFSVHRGYVDSLWEVGARADGPRPTPRPVVHRRLRHRGPGVRRRVPHRRW